MSFNKNCTNCENKIENIFYCNNCNDILCSTNCFISHRKNNHDLKTDKFASKNKYLLNSNPNFSEGFYINIKPHKLNSNEFSLFEKVKSNNNKFKILGYGTNSIVYLVKHKETQNFYALKVINKEILLKKNLLDSIYNEIDFHCKLFHKNIIHLIAVFEDENNINIILEYANSENLFSLIKKKTLKTEKEIFSLFIQILNAVCFLHENNLLHRDIKPENILLHDKTQIKLCDFGTCNENFIGNRNTICGTFEYMAPEIIKEKSYDKSVDVWSLGVVLFELTHGFTPFNMKFNGNKKYDEVIKELILNKFNFNQGLIRITSESCLNLMKNMIEYNPIKRIKMREILKDEFVVKFSNFNKKFNSFSPRISKSISLTNKNEIVTKNENKDAKNHSLLLNVNDLEKINKNNKEKKAEIENIRLKNKNNFSKKIIKKNINNNNNFLSNQRENNNLIKKNQLNEIYKSEANEDINSLLISNDDEIFKKLITPIKNEENSKKFSTNNRIKIQKKNLFLNPIEKKDKNSNNISHNNHDLKNINNKDSNKIILKKRKIEKYDDDPFNISSNFEIISNNKLKQNFYSENHKKNNFNKCISNNKIYEENRKENNLNYNNNNNFISTNLIDVISIFNQVEKLENLNKQLKIKFLNN